MSLGVVKGHTQSLSEDIIFKSYRQKTNHVLKIKLLYTVLKHFKKYFVTIYVFVSSIYRSDCVTALK